MKHKHVKGTSWNQNMNTLYVIIDNQDNCWILPDRVKSITEMRQYIEDITDPSPNNTKTYRICSYSKLAEIKV